MFQDSTPSNELIFHSNSKILKNGWALLLGALVLALLSGTATDEWQGWVLGAVFFSLVFLVWLCTALDCKFSRLRLSEDMCFYTNMVGRKREFPLNDVEYVYPSKWGYVLRGRDGKRICIIAKDGTVNIDRLIPFFEDVQARGVWRGSVLKEYEVAQRTQRETPHMPDTLVVSPSLRVFGDTLFNAIFTLAPLIMCLVMWIIPDMIEDDDIKRFVIIIITGLTFIGAIHTVLAWKKDSKVYRNMKMVLTPGECSMKEANNASYIFHFDDIEDVNVVIEEYGYKGNTVLGKFLYIQFKDGTKQKFGYDRDLKNLRKIQDFVAYHKRGRG